jgi:hypothetical protein
MEREPVNCYRCGQPGHVDWIDVSNFAQGPGTTWIAGNEWCLTPGCVDERGSRTLFAPTPADLRARADQTWMRRQRDLMEG